MVKFVNTNEFIMCFVYMFFSMALICLVVKSINLWNLWNLWKILTLAITFEPKEIELSYFTCVFLVPRPSCWNQIFYLVTLTLTFDLLLKKLNLDHNLWSRSDRVLILHTSIPCDKTFLLIPIFLTLWPWPWLWPTFEKDSNLLARGVLVPLGQTPI